MLIAPYHQPCNGLFQELFPPWLTPKFLFQQNVQITVGVSTPYSHHYPNYFNVRFLLKIPISWTSRPFYILFQFLWSPRPVILDDFRNFRLSTSSSSAFLPPLCVLYHQFGCTSRHLSHNDIAAVGMLDAPLFRKPLSLPWLPAPWSLFVTTEWYIV